jgi:hypothetical protein
VSGRGVSHVNEDAGGTDCHLVYNMTTDGVGEILVGQVNAKCCKEAGIFLTELLNGMQTRKG